MELERKIPVCSLFFLLLVPPAPSAAHRDTFQPLMPRPEGLHGNYCSFSGSTCTPPPGVSPSAPAPAARYLPWRCPGPAAAVPRPSLARRQLGMPGQRRERLAGEMETETHHRLRQREEEREGFPTPGSPELGNSDSCGAKGELLGFGVSPALRTLRSCRCPVGGEGKAEGGWRDAGVFHVENAPFDFIIHFGE